MAAVTALREAGKQGNPQEGGSGCAVTAIQDVCQPRRCGLSVKCASAARLQAAPGRIPYRDKPTSTCHEAHRREVRPGCHVTWTSAQLSATRGNIRMGHSGHFQPFQRQATRWKEPHIERLDGFATAAVQRANSPERARDRDSTSGACGCPATPNTGAPWSTSLFLDGLQHHLTPDGLSLA